MFVIGGVGIGGLGIWEVLLIFLVIAVLFGARRLPEVGAGLGKAIRSFKEGLTTPEPKEIEPTPEEKKKEP
jgi:sec-independent protein translocase protein TatA